MTTGALARLGVGLAALGRPAYINLGRTPELPPTRGVDALREAAWAVLDEVYAAGVRWVDVARSYGLAEEFLAGWLAERRHLDLTVSSKWGYTYVGDWRLDAEVHEVKEHSLDRFRTQWQESRDLLGTTLSLYQVHSLTSDSPLFEDSALQEALAALIDRGVRTGFSTSGPGQADTIRRALALQVAGSPLFTAVQATWNPLEPSSGTALAEAHQAGCHVLVKETLANGRLAVDPPESVAELARKYEVGPDAVAVAAALAQPWADTVLVGPSSPAQARGNLAAAELRLADEDVAALSRLAEVPEQYWATRSSLSWQ
jgi:aryl-alcohol dehydrogenase-like predicted oxidoreductase